MRHARYLVSLIAILTSAATVLAAPSVSNVSHVQQPDGAGATRVRVTYDLASPSGAATITLLYSTNSGAAFFPATTTTGDVGAGVAPGTARVIDWAVATDLPGQQLAGSFLVRVLAEDGVPIPLAITGSPMSDGAFSSAGNATITFSFAEPVSGFTSSDVVLVNASPGSFNVISPSVYTLNIVATTYGAVSVSVPAGAAVAASGTGNGNAADSFDYHFGLLDLVPVPAGTFPMGATGAGDDAIFASPGEAPIHTVGLATYHIGKHEVSNANWASVLNWALPRGYLASNASGASFTTSGPVYLKNSIGDPQLLCDLSDGFCQISFSAGVFAAKTTATTTGLESRAQHPVHGMTWYGAVAFCNFLSEREALPPAYSLSTWELIDTDSVTAGIQFAKGYRLPTEAEWERAAAWDGSKHWIYPPSTDSLPNYSRENFQSLAPDFAYTNPMSLLSHPFTSRTGWFNGVNISPNRSTLTINSPSPVGAYDMGGNLAEWCHDRFSDTYYTISPADNPTGPTSGTDRVYRGGNYFNFYNDCRTAARHSLAANFRNFVLGLRVAATP